MKHPIEPAPEIDVVVIGASAGGLSGLTDLVTRLPHDVGAALAVVQHFPTAGRSHLAGILRRLTTMPVVPVVDGRQLRRREILVARPNRHLLIDGTHVVLSRGATVNGHRPAIDPLFESVSRSFGPRVLGILLSGLLDDGVAGLGAVREAGGVTAVQDTTEAPHPDMPAAAIEAGVVDHVLPVAALADLVGSVTARGSGPLVAKPEDGGSRPESAVTPSSAPLSCPDCGGVLMETASSGIEQYECRVGHRYSPASLFQVQGDAVDDALWAAHRALLERADLARRMARRYQRGNLAAWVERHHRTAEEANRNADVLLRVLTGDGGDPESTEDNGEDVDGSPRDRAG